MYDTIDTILFKCKEDADYIWIVYFVPEKLEDKIDAIYASMHLSLIHILSQWCKSKVCASTVQPAAGMDSRE